VLQAQRRDGEQRTFCEAGAGPNARVKTG